VYGLGIGYVDAQLLAATKLTVDARLWTDDNRLAAVSDEPNNYVLEAAVEAGPLSDRL